MRRPWAFPGPALAILIGVAVVGCASASPSPIASASPAATRFTSPIPSATSSAASSPADSAAPSDGTACSVVPQTGGLPSDRLVSVAISTSDTVDFVTFVFDDGSLTPAGPPLGELSVARPPFTGGASGLPIDLAGEHALQIVMRGMSLYNDVGQPTYDGERVFAPDLPALRAVVLFDESEGVLGFYIGYDGTGCVDLVRDGTDVVLTIAH